VVAGEGRHVVSSTNSVEGSTTFEVGSTNRETRLTGVCAVRVGQALAHVLNV